MSTSDATLQPSPPVNVTTVPLGLGCAGLFGLPRRRDRRAVLEAAYDAGIRHFDVAPMYGLGLAEAELGHFVRTYGHDARVATKFGLAPSPLGRAAGLVQGPVRRVLNRSSSLRTSVRRSGGSPASGAVGRLLYRDADFSVVAARAGLERSLRRMRLEQVAVLLVHEPKLRTERVDGRLAGCLDDLRSRGLIGAWGLAGDLGHLTGSPSDLGRPDVLQYPYDVVDGVGGPATEVPLTVRFGFLSGGLAAVRTLFELDEPLRARCSELAGRDVAAPGEVAALLTRDAVRGNPGGVNLVSTTRPEHLLDLVRVLDHDGPDEPAALALIRARLGHTGGPS